MPGPGRQPTVQALLKGHGNQTPNKGKGHQPNEREPMLPIKEPPMPDHLDENAQVEWKRLVPILLDMRVLTESTYMSLANLCQCYSTMAAAQLQLTKYGCVIKAPSGFMQTSPYFMVVNHCINQITTLCREFGLTPSGKTRVRMESETDGPIEAGRVISLAKWNQDRSQKSA